MKKRVKEKVSKSSSECSEALKPEQPDLMAAIMKVAERLGALEKKMDVMISREPGRSPEPEYARNFQRSESSHRERPPQHFHHGSQQHDNRNQGGRMLHRAVCADCHQSCEVPFRPKEGRPVYCKECFSKHKPGRDSSSENRERGYRPNRHGHAAHRGERTNVSEGGHSSMRESFHERKKRKFSKKFKRS